MRVVSRYHPAIVAIHWFLAVLIIADLAIGTTVLAHIPNSAPRKLEALRAHMSAGMLILFLMTLRLALRVNTDRPAEAATGSVFLDRVAWLSHRALYVAAIGLPLSGVATALQFRLPQIVFLHQGMLPVSFWGSPFRYLHLFFARALIALIALHITGAAYHVLARRDGLLARMWFGRRLAADASSAGARTAAASAKGVTRVWFARAVLLAATLLFTAIGAKFALDPLHAAAASGITLTIPLGFTNTRAGFGGFPLAFAAILAFCLASPGRLRTGLGFIAVIAGTVLAVRVAGSASDGTLSESLRLVAPETLLLAASLVSLWTLRRQAAAPGRAALPQSAAQSSATLG
jgi:cytochrome b561